MPTVEQLIKRLEYLIDDTIDQEMAIELFNECQEDLAEVAGYAKEAEADLIANDSVVSLPIDLIEIAELKIKLNNDAEFKDYRMVFPDSLFELHDVFEEHYYCNIYSYEWFGNYIKIKPTPKKDGKLLIKYYAELPEIPNDLTFIPYLRTRFHRLYPLYAAMKYCQNYKDELQQKADFEREYLRGKEELAFDTLKRKSRIKPKRTLIVREWV